MSSVGLVADQTWWTEKDFSDDYKLASLGLWNEVIDSNERLSNCGLNTDQITCKQANNSNNSKSLEKPNLPGSQIISKKDKLLMPTCRMEVAQMQKALASMDPTVLAPLPQSILTDTRCILSANWPIALLKTYPALSNTLKNNNTLSIFSHKHAIGHMCKGGNTLPYSIDTVDELMYHKKIANSSVKNVWSNDNEKTVFNKAVWEPRLNANVPEFYPSVLLPPRQCPPRYSNVFGANYQAEVFPYNDDKTAEKKDCETSKRIKKKIRRGTSEQRLTQQLPGAASSSSPNLLRTVNATDKNSIMNSRQILRPELNSWLQNVYPHRIVELSTLRSIARHIEAINNHITPSFSQVLTPSTPAPASFAPSSERRLYRDVLARKIDDTIVDKTKDESEQNPFDELERQALEQYQSSETCLVNQASGNDINPDPEDSKFQDLEREALEQYTEDGDYQTERDSQSPNTDEINIFASDSKPVTFIQSSGGIDLNNLILFIDGPSNAHKSDRIDKGDLDDAVIAPESIVTSVVGVDKHNEQIQGSPQANEVLCLVEIGGSSFELPKSPDVGYNNKSKAKKNIKKKRQGDEENKYSSNKLQHDKLRSVNRASISYQLPNVLNVEEETRRLATNLKHKVLNYLKSVDLKKIKELDENKRPNVKHQLSKDLFERPIQERIKVADIDDLETYKSYIKEVSMKARSTVLLQFKRIRSEIMESTSRGIVPPVGPTTSEKRRVRQIIKKCLELRNHADTMNKTPRSPLNSVKREVLETLETVHNTMEVIYALSNLSKEAFKDVEFLKTGRTLVPELYTGSVTLEDKSDYIRQRVMVDERSILLVVLFPRTPGVLYDRGYEVLKKPRCRSIYYDHDLLRTDYAFLSRSIPKPSVINKVQKINLPYQQCSVKVYNTFKFSRMASKAIWDPNNWSHITELGRNRRRITIQFTSTGQQAEAFCRVLTMLRPVRLVSREDAATTHEVSPKMRQISSTQANTLPETGKKTWNDQKSA